MKETIDSIVYERFYKELRSKFYREFVKPNDQENSDNILKEESKAIWEEPYGPAYGSAKRNVLVVKDLFNASEYYFHRIYDEKAKQHIGHGYPFYPVTVDRVQFSLGLKYLLFGKEWNIDEFPDLIFKEDRENKKSPDWEKNYTQLLDLFMKEYFPNGVKGEQSDNRKDEDDEQTFLRIIATNSEILESKIIKKVILDFFSHLSSKSSQKYIRAWNKLTPQFQKYSLWDGYLSNFERSLACVTKIKCDQIGDFSYSFQRVRVSVTYNESGTLLNLPEFIKHRKTSSGAERQLFTYLVENIDKWDENFQGEQTEKFWRISRIKPYKKPLLSMTNEELMDVEFQKQVFLRFLNDETTFKDFYGGEYSKTYEKSEFILAFKHDEWKIDAILPNDSIV